ncbi:hypothetical protein EV663_1373 [Rhodovulum bhavnagarense]|uniref:PAC domain-containing protein n=1 Tax=Rhodovulum bhavnagarense TaxID=992286 RepID=A0A4R2R8U0_9RHOB|nr:hypothetical protein [Rhodovulum bhavnagarense]TCP58347.1 hypothetical protein EV663_1373 [Rhodovulum bhavnagarense]
MHCDDGRVATFGTRLKIVRDPKGNAIRLVASLSDISELRDAGASSQKVH